MRTRSVTAASSARAKRKSGSSGTGGEEGGSQASGDACAPIPGDQLVVLARGRVVSTGTVGKTGRSGGRPPALYAFADTRLRVTDEFATLKPPP